jgi:hypothetical protein
MKAISHVKLFRAGRLPNWDEPIVVVTFEQTREEVFCAEYFILYQKPPHLYGSRIWCREDASEFLADRPPEKVMEDVAEDARLQIQGQFIEKLPEEEQHKWILGPPYTLSPIDMEELRTLWFRRQLDAPICEMANTTHSMELKRELEKIVNLRRPKFTSVDPANPYQ